MGNSTGNLAKRMEQKEIDEDLRQILNLLAGEGSLKPNDIRMRLGLSEHQWRHRRGRLLGLGLIEPEMQDIIIKRETGKIRLTVLQEGESDAIPPR